MDLGIVEETVTNEELSAQAADVAAPEPTKRTRKTKAPKELTPEEVEAKAAKEAEKAAKKAEREARKAEKANKPGRMTLKDKFIKVLVPASETSLREGSGRKQFLQAAETATKCGDIIGQEFEVFGKTVQLTGANIIGMFSRGHIALSSDGETWERVQTTVVTE